MELNFSLVVAKELTLLIDLMKVQGQRGLPMHHPNYDQSHKHATCPMVQHYRLCKNEQRGDSLSKEVQISMTRFI